MRVLTLLLAVALVCGCGTEDERPAAAPEPGTLTSEERPRSLTGGQRPVVAPSPGTLTSDEHRFTAQVPDGWAVASKSLTPNLLNPVEILAAGTALDSQSTGGRCSQVATGALEDLGPRDAFVTVQERYGEPRFPDRPQRFALTGRVDHGDAATCARDEQALEEYWFGFRDAGRGFHVLVAFGPDAPPERRAEALALLDSLRFEPGPQGVHLDPDATVPHEDRALGLSWQMPMPPWRRYDWPLTSVRGQRLVLGTFELDPGSPDRNCTPRAALDAMPPTGRSSTCSSTSTSQAAGSRASRSAAGSWL